MYPTFLRPRWPGPRALLIDVVLALVACLFLTASAWWGSGHAGAGSVGPPNVHLASGDLRLLWLAGLPLAIRRVVPPVATAVTSLAVLGTILMGIPAGPVFLVGALQVGSLGSQASLRVSLTVAAATCALWLAGAAVAGQVRQLPVDILIWVPLLGVPWALGRTLRVRSRLHARAQQEEERRRSYGQRLEVAREVHDVVGHSLAVITMQSGIALHVMDRRPEQARVALEAIHQQSRDALDELRATLALYRGEVDAGAAPRRPAPRLLDLPALIDTMRASGLPVELSTTGGRNGVPAAVDLAGYRIVQESLTNVLRHAGEAQARVVVDYQEEEVGIEVTDNGRARPGVRVQPGGHGIAGMRERSAAVGGALEAGPMAEGGFRVRARLPLAAAGT